MENIVDLRKNLINKDLLDKITAASLKVLSIKIELLILDKEGENEKIEKLLKNFIEETRMYNEFDYFRKMKKDEQIGALIDTAIIILDKK